MSLFNDITCKKFGHCLLPYITMIMKLASKIWLKKWWFSNFDLGSGHFGAKMGKRGIFQFSMGDEWSKVRESEWLQKLQVIDWYYVHTLWHVACNMHEWKNSFYDALWTLIVRYILLFAYLCITFFLNFCNSN